MKNYNEVFINNFLSIFFMAIVCIIVVVASNNRNKKKAMKVRILHILFNHVGIWACDLPRGYKQSTKNFLYKSKNTNYFIKWMRGKNMLRTICHSSKYFKMHFPTQMKWLREFNNAQIRFLFANNECIIQNH